MNRTIYKRTIDVAWLLLLGATVALWFVVDGSVGSTVAPLMGIMVVKSALIAAVFMDLWRTSKLTFALVLGTMAIIGGAIVVFAG